MLIRFDLVLLCLKKQKVGLSKFSSLRPGTSPGLKSQLSMTNLDFSFFSVDAQASWETKGNGVPWKPQP